MNAIQVLDDDLDEVDQMHTPLVGAFCAGQSADAEALALPHDLETVRRCANA